jgi:regulator of RNase E activity RraB
MIKNNNIDAHSHRNQQLKIQLSQKGVDLNSPRSIELHFWAWNQKDASLLAKALYEKGLIILVLSPANIEDDPNCWNIEAGINKTIEEITDRSTTEELIKLADEFNAEFDGWGTSI